ncbi:dephospho-CoA kinase [Aestuariibacter halophilus]|uniref:Dephospho-CoA kinase n=1 Tax=Fluctibacter halophilus TaxID=226011 RepID=A0ABS8G795_9ALTE|nr:dephospho-CoA kinase [Aestuariibacter halophilus]MCC2616467.1 dephospho-CoA kinase [Aestuariibacter halophilus]
MSALVVGLTGGIGSGKTAVSDRFAKRGIDIIDADVIARQVVEPGQPALAQIEAHFSADILNPDGTLNRRALRAKVFDNPDQQQWLNQCLHPLIREQMVTQTQKASSPYCLLVVPLLVENNLTSLVDKVLVVDVDEAQQRARAAARDDQSAEQVQAIMDAQASRQQRLAAADYVIDNSAGPDALDAQIDALDQTFRKLLKNQPKA